MIVKKAIDDIELRLGQNTMDRKISRKQIAHWISIVLDELQDDDDNDEEEDEINPDILTRFECVALELKQPECDDCDFYYVLKLPVDVKKLNDDRGVYQVLRLGGKEVTRQSSPGMASLVARTQFAPEEYFYRIGDYLYLVGGKYTPSSKFHLILVTTDIENFSENEELPNPKSDRELLESVEKIGRRMLATPFDHLTDGKDEKLN